MTCCEFCSATEVPSYPLKLTLSGGPTWKPLQRDILICAECIDTLFYPDPEAPGHPIPITFIN